MGHNSNHNSSSKAVIWIVFGIVGGLTLFGAGIVVLGIMAYRTLGTSANATFGMVSGKGGPIARVEVPKHKGDKVGTLAPETKGQDLDNNPIKLSDYKGKVVMLDFWGNW